MKKFVFAVIALFLILGPAAPQGIPGCGIGIPRIGIGMDRDSCPHGIPFGGASLTLSNATIAGTATIGTTVGSLAVVGGIGSYTFTLTSNPGTLFAISGSNLNVAAALTPGSDPITIQANNGAGSIITQPFTITVTGTCSNKLDFSQSCNSQYLF